MKNRELETMEFANILTILVGALATAISVYVSWKTTKASIKSEEKRDAIEERRANMDEAAAPTEQAQTIGNISVQLIQTTQDQLNTVRQRLDEIDTRYRLERKERLRAESILNRVSQRLQAVLSHHEVQATQAHTIETCPGFEVVQQEIRGIVEEIDRELVLISQMEEKDG